MSKKKHKISNSADPAQPVSNETSLSRFCRRSLSFLVYSIFVVPAVFFSPWHLSSFEMTKNMFFVLLATWLLVAYVIWKIETKSWTFTKYQKIFLGLLGILFVFKFISFLFSPVKDVSFWGSMVRHEGLTTHFFLAVWAVVMMDFIKTKKQLNRFFTVVAIAASVIALYGDCQKFGIDFPALKWDAMAYVRIASSLGNPLFLSIYLIFTSAFTVYLMFQYKKLYARLLLAVGLILQLAAIVFTFTSSSILAIFGGLLFFGLWYFWNKKRVVSYGILAVGFSVVLLMVLVLSGAWSNGFFSRAFQDFSLQNQSNLQRLYVWQSAWDAFKAKTWFGWGNENFQAGFERYSNTNLITPLEMNYDRAHNIIFDRLVMEGIFVTLSYAALILYALYRGVKRYLRDNETVSLMAASLVVSSVLFYQVAFPTMNAYIMLFLVLGLIFVDWQEVKLVDSRKVYQSQWSWLYFILIIWAIIMTFQYVRPWSSDAMVKRSMSISDVIKRAQLEEQAYDKWPTKEILIDLYKRQITVVKFASDRGDAATVNKYLDKAKNSVTVLLERYPNYYLVQCVAADFYRTIMNEPLMTQHYQIAQSLGPTRYEVRWLWGDSLYSLDKIDAAIAKYQEAIDINPAKAEPYRQMSLLYQRIGNADKAKEYEELAETKK